MTNLDIFRNAFLNANTWAQRKDGVPLYLLDKLSKEELTIAERELIKALGPGDSWPILGLGHIQSKAALPGLYDLLAKSERNIKVTIAHSIFQICRDPRMIDIVLTETPKAANMYELIDVLYMLPDFHDERVTQMLNSFREHEEYLVAYNATRVMGLNTDEVVLKFRDKNAAKKATPPDNSQPKAELSWWQKLFGA